MQVRRSRLLFASCPLLFYPLSSVQMSAMFLFDYSQLRAKIFSIQFGQGFADNVDFCQGLCYEVVKAVENNKP